MPFHHFSPCSSSSFSIPSRTLPLKSRPLSHHQFPEPKFMDNHHQGTHTPSRPRHGGGGLGSGGAGGREDCWSEGATETLIEAWGDRYLQLNRGNLRQKDWKEVADVVNDRQNGVKPRRTDVQCKNRIDTLKKKYKLEKTKPAPSKWPFYYRLDHLVGTAASVAPSNRKIPSSLHKPPSTVAFTVKARPKSNNNPNLQTVVYSAGSSRMNSSGSNENSLGGGRRDDEVVLGGGVRKPSRMDYVGFSDEIACKELARAILRFGEIYERIESTKQQQMLELEKQRMEFTKDIEVQRMNLFVEAQLELEKTKRPSKNGAGKKL